MPESKSALIIANSSYTDAALRQLLAPAQDAVALAEVLQDPQIGDFAVTTVLNQPSYKIRTAVEEFFADRKRDDLLLAYFSGHGIKDEDGQLYFAASDTQLVRHRLRRATAVEAAFVNEAMRRCLSRRQVLLLDCCYSGAFKEGMLARGGPGVDTRERFEGTGRVVLAASDAMQYSFEPDGVTGEGVQSYFTSALVHGLRTGEADIDQDGLFSLDDIYDYVHERLADQAPDQSPMKIGYAEGKIFLARNPYPKPAKLSAELEQAIASGWVPTRLAAVNELARLQNGANRRLAEAARRELNRLADDDSREVSQAAAKALVPLGEELSRGDSATKYRGTNSPPTMLLFPAQQQPEAATVVPSVVKAGAQAQSASMPARGSTAATELLPVLPIPNTDARHPQITPDIRHIGVSRLLIGSALIILLCSLSIFLWNSRSAGRHDVAFTETPGVPQAKPTPNAAADQTRTAAGSEIGQPARDSHEGGAAEIGEKRPAPSGAAEISGEKRAAPSGVLGGVVTDDIGTPLPGVTLTLKATHASRSQVQVTNAQGAFRFGALAGGRYSLKGELEGFSTVEFPDIRLENGMMTRVGMQLSAAAVGETITVLNEHGHIEKRRPPLDSLK